MLGQWWVNRVWNAWKQTLECLLGSNPAWLHTNVMCISYHHAPSECWAFVPLSLQMDSESLGIKSLSKAREQYMEFELPDMLRALALVLQWLHHTMPHSQPCSSVPLSLPGWSLMWLSFYRNQSLWLCIKVEFLFPMLPKRWGSYLLLSSKSPSHSLLPLFWGLLVLSTGHFPLLEQFFQFQILFSYTSPFNSSKSYLAVFCSVIQIIVFQRHLQLFQLTMKCPLYK